MSVKYHDYYATLGVARDASEKEIKAAYRKMARKYHPDTSKDAASEQKFKEVSEAYEVLKDPDKRARYDQLGHNWQQGQDFSDFQAGGFDFRNARTGGSGDFSDFFDILFNTAGQSPFGGARGRGQNPFEDLYGQASQPPRQEPLRGEDKTVDLNITLEEAWRGAKKNVKIRSSTKQDGRTKPVTHELEIRIPEKATENMKIKVPGRGTPGRHGGPAGDLYLNLKIRSSERFSVDGKDLIRRVDIAPWDAALGAKLPIDLFGEHLDVNVPKRARGDEKLRIKGKGLKNRTGQGDLYVQLHLVMPDDLNHDELNQLAHWRDRRSH